MKRIIYKYPITLADLVDVSMPEGAYVLTAQIQGEQLCLWAIVNPDPEVPKFIRQFEIIGTGNPFTEAPRRHIATVQQGRWVWHVFECL